MLTIDLSKIVMPTGSAEEMVFHTFRGYLEAICNWTTSFNWSSTAGLRDCLALGDSWGRDPSAACAGLPAKHASVRSQEHKARFDQLCARPPV